MIKILHNSRYWLELTQTWLHTQVSELPEDIDNHIVCYDTQNLDRFPQKNINVFSETFAGHLLEPAARFGKMTNIRFKFYNQWVYKIVKQLDATIMHSHFGPLSWYCHDAATRANLKHIVTFYGADVNQIPTQKPEWYGYYEQVFSTIACVLCEGPFMAEKLVKLGCPREKIRVHHLGIQLETVEYNFCSWQAGEPLKILIAASFREKKGIPYAMEAIGKIAKEVPLEVTLIGDAGQAKIYQREKNRILEVIQQYKLENIVNMLGYQPYPVLLQAMRDNHIFLSPSVLAANGDSEGGAPVSIIEAAASGTMIVSTTHCDIPNVVKNGETGLLAPERDVDGLVMHLRWLIQNPDKWEKMADEGRKHIEQNFDAKLQGQKLGEIYREIASNNF